MRVVDAEDRHIEQFLSKPIRQDDIDEWFVASGGMSVPVIMNTLLSQDPKPTIRALLNDADECICLWGLTPGPLGEGLVWLIATVEAESHGRHIHRYWPGEIARMHMQSSLLVAIAYGGNSLHLGWLEAVGFVAVGAQAVGPGGHPFITYVRNMPCALQ